MFVVDGGDSRPKLSRGSGDGGAVLDANAVGSSAKPDKTYVRGWSPNFE
jgi:hypothetical protein